METGLQGMPVACLLMAGWAEEEELLAGEEELCHEKHAR